MGFASLLKGLLGALTLILGLFRDKSLRQEGVKTQELQDTKEMLHDVKTANDAGAAIERELVLHPDRVRNDDGFKRPD